MGKDPLQHPRCTIVRVISTRFKNAENDYVFAELTEGAFPERNFYAGDTAIARPRTDFNNADFVLGRTPQGEHVIGYVFDTRGGLVISTSPIGDDPGADAVVDVEGRIEWICRASCDGLTLPISHRRPILLHPCPSYIVNWETDGLGRLSMVSTLR